MSEYKILFVDDDDQILDLGQDFLEQDSFEVDRTTDPEKAYDMFVENSYDAVISDYDMPEMDGAELHNMIRDYDEDIPFFLHTGRELREVSLEETDRCITSYFQKAGLESYEQLGDRVKACSGD